VHVGKPLSKHTEKAKTISWLWKADYQWCHSDQHHLYKLNELKRPKENMYGTGHLSTIVATWLFDHGCTNPRIQATVAVEVCTVVAHVFGFWV
jgi:hypothetical protein